VHEAKAMLLRAYTTYVRPLLEYNTVIWSLRLNVMSLLLRKCKGGLQSAYLDSEISVMPNAEVNST